MLKKGIKVQRFLFNLFLVKYAYLFLCFEPFLYICFVFIKIHLIKLVIHLAVIRREFGGDLGEGSLDSKGSNCTFGDSGGEFLGGAQKGGISGGGPKRGVFQIY